jgi:alkylated DNA repair dioxygenase AlkB
MTQLSLGGRESIDAPDAEIWLTHGFFTPAEADTFASDLIASADWEQQTLKLFGRRVAAPRLSAWYGDPGARYAYSGLTLEPKPWLPALREIRSRIRAATRVPFNSVLLNLYRDGCDSMGWHSDDERELGPAPTIASVSFGGVRRFLLRHRTRRDLATVELLPEHGSLLVMAGTTQRHWKHAVPKTARPAEPRLNLTFRVILPDN